MNSHKDIVVVPASRDELEDKSENIDDSMMDSISEGDLINRVTVERPIQMGEKKDNLIFGEG